MDSKYITIKNLSRETKKHVTKNEEEWKRYLQTVAQIYRYPFQEQILIYAQRPDAKACASIEIWNKKMYCWVNRGAKGIALLDEEAAYPKLKYVFDLSDVHEGRIKGEKPYLWKMQEQHKEGIIARLESVYGGVDENQNFEAQLLEIVERVTEDNLEDILDELEAVAEGSFLENLERDSLRIRMREALYSSIAFTVFTRCGVDVNEYENNLNFGTITEFNTIPVLTILGTNISDLSKPLLREIGISIHSYEQNMVKAEQIAEKIKKDIAKDTNVDYNALKRKSGKWERKERGNQYESDLSTKRGLSDSEFDNRRYRREADQVRPHEKNLSEGGEERNLRGDAVGGYTHEASYDHSGAGRRENGTPNETDAEGRGRGRTVESAGSNAVGSANEQYQESSRRNHPTGINLSVEELLASEEKTTEYEQISLFVSPEEQRGNIAVDSAEKIHALSSAFLISDTIVDDVLLTGGGKDDSRIRIAAEYQKGKSRDEMVEFLKQEYDRGGKGFEYKEKPVAVWYDNKGMNFNQGTSARYDAMRTITWEEVAERLVHLIESGQFMESVEANQISLVIRQELAKQIYFFFQDEYNQIPEFLEEQRNNVPKAEEKIRNMLESATDIDIILARMDEAIEKLDSGEVKPRFRLIHKPKDIRKEVWEQLLEVQEFPKAEQVELRRETFITDDEIDDNLTWGSGFQQGKYRIYEFFQDVHDQKEQVDFLKKEYGIGGRSHALPGKNGSEKHDAKGIRLEKGDTLIPNVDILLSWNKVAQRIQKLIAADHFMTPQEKEYWKEKQEQKTLEKTQQEQYIAHDTIGKIKEATQIKVAIETTEDYSEPAIGFYTYHYPDGREGVRFRLVTVGEEGKLVGYPQANKFFINEDAIHEFIEAHREEFTIINYDNMVYHAGRSQVSAKIEQTPAVENTQEEIDQEVAKQTEPQADTEPLTPFEPTFHVTPTIHQSEPQIDKTGAVNFHITDDALGVGTAKQKFGRNVTAIITLQLIESEKRNATPEEQQLLSQYAGWGGLAEAFDDKNSSWTNEYLELKGLLSESEYCSARESTLNAHYTSPTIIRAIYDAIDRMGFQKGNILEPAMGTGNFFGMLPKQMKDSRLYGVELDSLTGRIAKQLYPKATIQVTGFEKTDYPDSFFDVAVGNVPFGNYKIRDRKYDKNHFMVHDYFFGKTLDQVRPGGVIAFITSKGTLDKESPAVRKYIAQRAELLGAVRLPNTAFKANAGTEVTADIVFLKKRDRIVDIEPAWVYLGLNENGISMNQYFIDHPEMIVGSMEKVSGPFGMETTCKPREGEFKQQLQEALSHMEGQIAEIEVVETFEDTDKEIFPANPLVKNYSYTCVEDTVYYRENSIMRPVDASDSMLERIKGMIEIRECTYHLINVQLDEFGEDSIKEGQEKLNRQYDDFTKKYGLLNSQTNERAFREDVGYCLLCSLEELKEDGTLKQKADMFHKRTIKRHSVVESVDTASEALAVSMQEKALVDLEYMSSLTGKDKEMLTKELTGIIFCNPLTEKWETADEYLSGNVREKLNFAKEVVKSSPEYCHNIEALQAVQPKELDASDIDVRIGATWIAPEYMIDFIEETFETPERLFERGIMDVKYSPISGQWNVEGKNADNGNVLAYNTFGTGRANAYRILEDSLNLKDVRIFDTMYEDGKEKRVLNKKETTLAAQKQEAIREQFKNWIFKDQGRREQLCKTYNELFNSVRQREYDGSHLMFPGMHPEIILGGHQKNAVARQLYGYNSLLAHTVGAGKTYTMVAAAMEMKRLGLAQKPLFVVPNHLIGQWASEFLRLYPGANILAATKRDFEPANRKKFCSRIATGEYDAVIIGHSQYEKIPLSIERQKAMIERQISEITDELNRTKEAQGERYTIKQMEKTKKLLQARLDKLSDTTRKDNVVTFEQLGVDRLFVDESHGYKNLFLYTKMRNVAGIAQTEAQKSSDMFAKCQYIDELTGGRGITFATGTPISNSMTELYTNMRYLMHNTLQKLGLGHFDSWASSFGETTTAIELAPEGTGYRAKTRFSKFFNLPELIGMFKEVADIQTADMLKLPVPKANYHDVVLHPSEQQKEMVQGLAERAECVRNGGVDATVDNMLKITNDGRKLALDQKLIHPLLPENPESKSNACVREAFRIWEDSSTMKGAQLIFCDLSTPKGNGEYNVYEDIRKKLIEKEVPPHEIAFIHEANTDKKKTELFTKVRSGQVRFLLGSTAKMGAGTNVQDRLVALHHLDVPWRPSDIEQQEGRILRQGNQNAEVDIFRYITEGTFDAYSWQLIENKQKFIGQIMTSKSPVRSAEDIDEAALSYAEVKALATGNPYIKEKMDLDIQVSRLKLLKANHTSQIYRLEDAIVKDYPKKIAIAKEHIEGYEKDIALYNQQKPNDPELFSMKIGERVYTEKKEAGAALLHVCQQIKIPNRSIRIGEYVGMKVSLDWDSFWNKFTLYVSSSLIHKVEMGIDPLGNITRLKNMLDGMEEELWRIKEQLDNFKKQLSNAKIEVQRPFEKEQELAEKVERLNELNTLLNMDEKLEEIMEEEQTETMNRLEDVRSTESTRRKGMISRR